MHDISALSFWKMNGYTQKDVDQAYEQIGRILALRLKFTHEKCDISCNERTTNSPHILRPMLTFINRVIEFSPHLDGSLIFCLEDGVRENLSQKAPALAFGKKQEDHYGLLVPNREFINTSGYLNDCREIDQATLRRPWETKEPTAFWRGSSTGGGLDGDTWEQNPRVKLCMHARELNDNQVLDAYLSKIVQCEKEECIQRIIDSGIVKDFVPFLESLRYKYLINIDGNWSAWGSLFLKLYSNSVVLRVESDNIEWFHHKIHPWVHYIPVENDLVDLKQKIAWARSHDQQCKEISENATRLIKTVQSEDPVAYTADLITKIFSCQR